MRILYAARRAREAAPLQGSDPLVAVGRELAAALSLAGFEEGTLGHRAALDRAACALARLGEEMRAGDGASCLAGVARARVLQYRDREGAGPLAQRAEFATTAHIPGERR